MVKLHASRLAQEHSLKPDFLFWGGGPKDKHGEDSKKSNLLIRRSDIIILDPLSDYGKCNRLINGIVNNNVVGCLHQ